MRCLTAVNVVAVVAAVSTTSCTDALLDVPAAQSGAALYAELWRVFDEGYAPFTERNVDWAAAFVQHEPAPDANAEAVFDAAASLLAELDDGHVTLVAPGRPTFVAKRTFRENAFDFDIDVGIVFSRMTDGPHSAGAARYGVLPGDIGYIHVSSWSDPIPDLGGVMQFLAGRTGVIVDLRHNPGGDFTNGFPFAAHFADARRLAFTTETKVGPRHGQLGQRVEWYIEPSAGLRYNGPAVVLTNGYTNSAAERTLMAFRTMPKVTTVGSPTAGNHGEKVGGQLSNGWQYSIVPQVVTSPDGVSYEGPGLPPDILVENTAAEVAAGLDRQFEAALEVLQAATPPP